MGQSKFDNLVNKAKGFVNATEQKIVKSEEKKPEIKKTEEELIHEEDLKYDREHDEWKHGMVFNCTALNLRKEPTVPEEDGEESNVIESIPYKEEVMFTECDNVEWVKVKYKGKEGFCMTEFIKDI